MSLDDAATGAVPPFYCPTCHTPASDGCDCPAGADAARGFPFAAIEPVWQAAWESADIFRATRTPGRPKWFVLELPPFANGALHLGHVRNYTMGDVTARFHRMAGYDVLYTTGFDSFGLPNELAAREEQRHPADVAERAIARIAEQLRRLGLSHDAGRITAYHEPEYYRWVQWVFLRLFEAGWAYRRHAAVNWCASCQTSLADSLVDAGRCWRCNVPVELRVLAQWFIDEARFAGAMLDGLPALTGWPERIKTIHTDWIGRRRGFEVRLPLIGAAGAIVAFVDHPSLLLGAEFVAIRRDHPILAALEASSAHGDVVTRRLALLDSRSREVPSDEHAGTADVGAVSLGIDAVNAMGEGPLPVLVVGHGGLGMADAAVIGVPGHRRWDHRVARVTGRAGRTVLAPPSDSPPSPSPSPSSPPAPSAFDWDERWIVTVPGDYQGLTVPVADERVARVIGAVPAVRYRLRDWSIARQRYWGPPVPIVHCPACGEVGVPDSDLPVRLPYDVDVHQQGNPLDDHAAFLAATCPRCGGPARRDTDTLEAYSSPWWMHWLCMSPGAESPFDREDSDRWMPVDVMIGGNDQARTCFFHTRMMERALHALGVVDVLEPVRGLVAIGMVKADGRKMSKSQGNVVNPMDLIARYGADALRLAILTAAAPDSDVNWSEAHARRAFAFLNRLWRFVTDERQHAVRAAGPIGVEPGTPLRGRLAIWIEAAVQKTTSQLERYHYHLAGQTVEFLFGRLERFAAEARRHNANDARDAAALRFGLDVLLRLLAPMCPHVAEELWRRCGRERMIAVAPWPEVPHRTGHEAMASAARGPEPAHAAAGSPG